MARESKIGENIKKYRKNKVCRRKILLRNQALNIYYLDKN